MKNNYTFLILTLLIHQRSDGIFDDSAIKTYWGVDISKIYYY